MILAPKGYLRCIRDIELLQTLFLGGHFFKRWTVLYFFLKTGKRYRPNSFCIVIYAKFVLGWTFFRTRSCPMTSSPYPVNANSKNFKIEKNSHVTHHSSPKTLKSLFPALLVSIKSVVRVIFMVFKKFVIGNIHGKRHGNLITSSWRHRTLPEAEKSSAQYKFAEYSIAKRIRSISLTSF